MIWLKAVNNGGKTAIIQILSIKKTTKSTSITTINTYLANIYLILRQEISWITIDYTVIIKKGGKWHHKKV